MGHEIDGDHTKSGIINILRCKSSYYVRLSKVLEQDIADVSKGNFNLENEIYNLLFNFFRDY